MVERVGVFVIFWIFKINLVSVFYYLGMYIEEKLLEMELRN